MTVLTAIRKIAADRRGTAVIETAIVLPVLLMLAFGFVDLGEAFATQMSIQQVAQMGADFVVAAGSSVPTDSQIKSEVASRSGLPASAIAIRRAFECNGAPQPSGEGGCPNADDTRVDYLTVSISQAYQPVLNIAGIADFVRVRNLNGAATVRLPKP